MGEDDLKETDWRDWLLAVFRAALIGIFPWAIWVTSSLFGLLAWKDRKDDFDANDAHALEVRMIERAHEIQEEFTKGFVRKDELELLDRAAGAERVRQLNNNN